MKRHSGSEFIREFIFLMLALILVSSVTLPRIFPSQERIALDEGADSPGISAVSAAADAGFAYLNIETESGVQLSHAYLMINGIRCGDFSTGSRICRVSPGDVIEIDAVLYNRAIPFRVSPLSSKIDGSYINARPVTNGDITRAAVIVCR